LRRTFFVVAALLALAVPASASAARPQPLNQYVVSHIKPKALQRAGFDMSEAVTPRAKGKFAIVATPSQAAALRAKGATVTAPFGVTKQRPRTLRARASARAAATLTHGYNVFRPWSLDPAPCPGTCSTPNIPLKDWYHQYAAKFPSVVKEEVIGHSVQGQAIVAYKVTQGARDEADASRPTILFDSTQHAREWISTEVNRRLFKWFLDNSKVKSVKTLLQTREVWFVPMDNPDGYDYTFLNKGTRLWRKNLRDNDHDGQITNQDGVDPNRNWPFKWNYDLEGASNIFTTETFHGASAGSEPEVQAIRGLEDRIDPLFQIDYHSFAKLILYPEGWQVETPATDAPLMKALVGDSAKPAVPGFDPEVSAQLYTTNGDITGDALKNFKTQSFTVELDGGTGDPVGGTDNSDAAFGPGGFVFQDSESDVQDEFEKNLPFAKDLVKSATHPDDPTSHLGNVAPAMVPTKFTTSNGNPQTVEVNAKRSLGAITAHWTVDGGAEQTAPTSQFDGGNRYGDPGVYYHRMRAQITGVQQGHDVTVWFTGGGKTSQSFTYHQTSDTGADVLLMVAEDYTGRSGLFDAGPYDGPRYAGAYTAALDAAGISYDVYDVDAMGRKAPSQLGVLSHYKAVVWETGDDLYVRNPNQPGGTGTRKLLDDEVIATRDYMNEGGKLLVAGQAALQGGWDQFLYNPLGDDAAFCNSNQTAGNGQADAPPGQAFPCIIVSNDFQQYWLGAYQNGDGGDPAAAALHEVSPVGSTEFGLNGDDSAQNQAQLYRFLTTSSVLKKDEYPQFSSDPAIVKDGPPAYDPPEGTHYAYSQVADQSYKRLSTTVDLTGHTSGSLSFKLSYDTEPRYDFVFIEAHTVGQDDWTTLPVPGITTQDVGAGCPDNDPFWLALHPFLNHYLTRSAKAGGGFQCTPHGNVGSPAGDWNAATGNSGGFRDWNVDLSSFAGKNVEVSITYEQDPASDGLGVFVDDVKINVDGSQVAATGFEDGLGPFTVGGPPAGSPGNANNWIQSASVGFQDGPGVRTDHSVYWGFGLEGVTGAGNRATLIGDALHYLGV
jgi:Zinc carboxypeptidase/Immune inhibitor A-like, MAM domain